MGLRICLWRCCCYASGKLFLVAFCLLCYASLDLHVNMARYFHTVKPATNVINGVNSSLSTIFLLRQSQERNSKPLGLSMQNNYRRFRHNGRAWWLSFWSCKRFPLYLLRFSLASFLSSLLALWSKLHKFLSILSGLITLMQKNYCLNGLYIRRHFSHEKSLFNCGKAVDYEDSLSMKIHCHEKYRNASMNLRESPKSASI